MELNSQRRQKRVDPKRGAAMLEAALTLLAFLTMVLGVLDFGQFLYVHQALTERVRFSARTGAAKLLDAATIRNLVVYGTTNSPSGSPPPPGFLGLTPGNVSISFDGANTNAVRLQVSVTGYQYPVFSPFIAGRRSNMAIRVTVPLETP